MRKPFLNFFLLLTAYCLLPSCKQDAGNAEWNIDVLAPVLKTTLTLNNLVEDSLIVANPDQSLKLVYNRSLYDLPVDSILNIPDTVITNPVTTPIALDLNPGVNIPPINNNTRYNLKDAEIVEAFVRSGTGEVEVTNNLTTKVIITYTIPLATLNGTPFSFTAEVGANSSITESFDMAGYYLDLRGINGTSNNTLVTSFTGHTDPAGQSVHINAGQTFITVKNSFIGIVPQYARGYFGSQSLNVSDSTDFSAFKKIIDGSIGLENVTLSLDLENSIGADAQALINQLACYNSQTGNMVNLSHAIIGNPVNITRASEPWHYSGNVASTVKSYLIDKDNSNILEFIENLPDKLYYSLDFNVNPLGNISSGNDFFYYDKNINANIALEVPLSFYADNLTLSDTLDFSTDANDIGKHINSGNFRLVADNGFPLSAKAQLYLLDENNVLLDSLLADNVIAAPGLDADFKVVQSLVSNLILPVGNSTGEKLNNTRKINIKIIFDTPLVPQLMKIYDGYKMDIKIIGDFNYTINQP